MLRVLTQGSFVEKYQSWGGYPHRAQPLKVFRPLDRFSVLPEDLGGTSFLPYGYGRSYGDVCLNSQGSIISSQSLNHFIHFDQHRGILRC
ncbi:MAG: hypothetical protein KAG18_08450, partial [Sinobacterium sp.]|nr:hypothetical protein [Sinobacterium sp.]